MTDVIPCIFQTWKEIAFERRANKIRHILSEKDKNFESNNLDEDFQDDYEEEDFQADDQEEFMKVEGSDQSCTIIPANNLQA